MEASTRRLPTLVQLCQRVASMHVDSIPAFGDLEVRDDLILPVLERCSAETLMRLEESSPPIQKFTPQLWKDMCFRSYPLHVDKHATSEPESWKAHYFLLRGIEVKRLEEVGKRIRDQRVQADEHKRDGGLKMIDRVPPMKRTKYGTIIIPTPAKTLFQKTRSEVSRIQKTMHKLPMPAVKTYRVLPPNSSPLLPPVPTSNTNRVTVNMVVRRKPITVPRGSLSVPSSSDLPAPQLPKPSSLNSTSSSSSKHPLELRTVQGAAKPLVGPVSDSASATITEQRQHRSISPTKKTASLFMPKHRAHSQRPK